MVEQKWSPSALIQVIDQFIEFMFLFQQIMKDRWINAGSEEEELKPFIQPDLDIGDQARIGTVGSLCLEGDREPLRSGT